MASTPDNGPANAPAPALSDSQRMDVVRQFTSGLAHEGRNALQQIVSCAELLGMELADEPASLDLVQGIVDASTRLNRMFNDLRSYCLKLDLAPRLGEVSTVWRGAWLVAQCNAPDRVTRLVEPALPADLTARFAQDALSDAFARVFENAIGASPDPALVEIQIRATELAERAAWGIGIRDSGPGFSEESQRRAFEPFYSGKTHGAGLGLCIVRRVVEAHGGQVTVGNSPEGGGLVEFLLPRD